MNKEEIKKHLENICLQLKLMEVAFDCVVNMDNDKNDGGYFLIVDKKSNSYFKHYLNKNDQ